MYSYCSPATSPDVDLGEVGPPGFHRALITTDRSFRPRRHERRAPLTRSEPAALFSAPVAHDLLATVAPWGGWRVLGRIVLGTDL